MARSRMDLHRLLLSICPTAYFQPPSNDQMQYPCIIYNLDDIDTDYADNGPYRSMKRYEVTVIDEDPDSELPNKVRALPLCSFNRHFTAENFNHDVFNLYF